MTHGALGDSPEKRSRDRALMSAGFAAVALVLGIVALSGGKLAVGFALLVVTIIGGLMARSFVEDMRHGPAVVLPPTTTQSAANEVLAKAETHAQLQRTPVQIVMPDVLLDGWHDEIDFVLAGPVLAAVDVRTGGANGPLKLNADGTILTRAGLLDGGADIRRRAELQGRKLANAVHAPAQVVVVIPDAATPPLTDWPGVIVCDEASLPGVVRSLPAVPMATDPEDLGKIRRIVTGEVAPLPDWTGTNS